MREERFRIQCPEHFQVGDSGRFEKPSQDKDCLLYTSPSPRD